ncbi:MAG: flagellar basal body-associated protein FliL [Limisphaerales bacterium]
MPGQRPEPGRGGEEKQPRESRPEPADAAAPAESAPKPAPAGSWKAWLPLGASIVAMPLLAYAFTTFVLAPQLQKALHGGGTAAAETKPSSSKEGAAPSGPRQTVALNKLLVNVAGTMGSRYLLTSLTMMGTGSDFQHRIADKEPQLRDLASSILMAKTIADIEKPGARNLIRGELLAGFNTILGDPGVQEIYFTEFAIQ